MFGELGLRKTVYLLRIEPGQIALEQAQVLDVRIQLVVLGHRDAVAVTSNGIEKVEPLGRHRISRNQPRGLGDFTASGHALSDALAQRGKQHGIGGRKAQPVRGPFFPFAG